MKKPYLLRWILCFVLVGVALYFATGAFILRFAMAGLLFPRTPVFNGQPPDSIEHVTSDVGNEMMIRRYGNAGLGCIVLFPGQHGSAARYDVSPYTAAGIEVLLLAYPGQDGASGSVSLKDIEDLARKAVHRANESCPEGRVALVGVSLGSMLAAYASRGPGVAGLVLVSTAPSLSAAIRTRLTSSWYLAPLSVLPLSQLVPHDYSLSESLMNVPIDGVVIFQGTNDEQTPLSDLANTVAQFEGLRLERVSGGAHSTTFALSRDAQIAAIARMLAPHGRTLPVGASSEP